MYICSIRLGTTAQAKAMLLRKILRELFRFDINKRRDKSRLYGIRGNRWTAKKDSPYRIKRTVLTVLILQFITVSFGFVDLVDGIGIVRGGRIEGFSFAGVSVRGKGIDDSVGCFLY